MRKMSNFQKSNSYLYIHIFYVICQVFSMLKITHIGRNFSDRNSGSKKLRELFPGLVYNLKQVCFALVFSLRRPLDLELLVQFSLVWFGLVEKSLCGWWWLRVNLVLALAELQPRLGQAEQQKFEQNLHLHINPEIYNLHI